MDASEICSRHSGAYPCGCSFDMYAYIVHDLSLIQTHNVLRPTLNQTRQCKRIQGSLFASDINIYLYIGICLGDVPFKHKQYITDTCLVINNSNHNYKHTSSSTVNTGTYIPICTYTLLTYQQTYAALYRQASASCAPNLQSKHTQR